MTLCERLLRHEPLAFDELVASGRARLLAVVASRYADAAAAEDAVQEIFIAAHRQLSTFQGTTDQELWAWLNAIATRFPDQGT